MKGTMKKFAMLAVGAIMAFSCLPTASKTASAVSGLPEGATVKEILYENDFSATNALDDWTLDGLGVGWQWNADQGVATVKTDGLQLSASKGTKAVALPALGVIDYVYTATIKVLGEGGSFGLLADMQSPVSQTENALHALVYVGNSSDYGIYHYNRVGEMHYTQKYNNPIRLLGDEIAQGDTCVLSLYCIEGVSYFYINNAFISSNELYGGSALFDSVGIYASETEILVTDVSVKRIAVEGLSYAMSFDGATVRYADKDGYTDGEGTTGLRFVAKVDKTDEDYKTAVPSGEYTENNQEVRFGMLLLPEDLLEQGAYLTKDTPWVLDVPLTKIANQTEDSITFTLSLLDIPEEFLTRYYIARMYMEITENGKTDCVYSRTSLSRNMVGVGNKYYEDIKDVNIRARLDTIFTGCSQYYGGTASRVTFSLFSDFHYVEGMYLSSMADMQAILDKAHQNNVDFIIHGGDFCNNYKGSPELFQTYLENNYNMPAYGIYGNHELESGGNSMQVVTPLLTNRKDEVVWGTADKKIGDGSIGYYYFDVNGIRMICTDTNYSWNPTTQVWEHNYTASHNKPSGNEKGNALGPIQLAWLESVLNDAADKKMSCVVVSHQTMIAEWAYCPDGPAVRALFKKVNERVPGTVLLAINGHLHTNHLALEDGVLYLDMNTVRNGAWLGGQETYHYGNETFEIVRYNDDGSVKGTSTMLINNLTQAKNTWFFADPMSAIVTVSSSGRVEVQGMETTWLHGIIPPNDGQKGVETKISNGVYDLRAF